jgi:hypothetical protein
MLEERPAGGEPVEDRRFRERIAVTACHLAAMLVGHDE